MYRSFSGIFSRVNTTINTMADFSNTRPCRACPISLRTELSTVVFAQHIHPKLILVIFASMVVSKRKFTTGTLEWKK
jgi:hypothetical protein